MADADAERASKFLAGESLTFAEANALWATLKKDDQISLARLVLREMRVTPGRVIGGVPGDAKTRTKLCAEEALLTSKDPELNMGIRHDDAFALLREGCRFIDDRSQPADGDALGIAGGIYKRRWRDLGQLDDLLKASEFYRRAMEWYGVRDNRYGDDAYPHINAAFVEDVLAAAGDDPLVRRARAAQIREDILAHLAVSETWWNAATRAEALFGLRRYDEATEVISRREGVKPVPWELRSMAEQLAELAHLHEARPLEVPGIRTFFASLLPGGVEAIRGVIIGKVGLALSGGGFRASFYHLGVLACLAERDVLRYVDVLSCVSGGSIVGACYWLKLRQRMQQRPEMTRQDYVTLVRELIDHFEDAVGKNLRARVQPYLFGIGWRLLRGIRGALDPVKTARALDMLFYQPLWSDSPGPVHMDELPFTPPDHRADLAGPGPFNPAKHNWLRACKVPALILNATTVNTGHAWQFTSTWMGESPWAVHQSADSVPRLQWSYYNELARWRIELGSAVAASACVPMVFAPLPLGRYYQRFADKDISVSLVDGGVHDNQGTVSLLASNCNVILVSDACGQLLLEHAPKWSPWGVVKSASRSMDTLMERVRLASFGDLAARQRSGLLRGLMFLHMKAGLAAPVIPLQFSNESYATRHDVLGPSGVRRDFQQALAELRTDLDVFKPEEARGLMACGYKMASKAIDEQLPKLRDEWAAAVPADWTFSEMLTEITSVAPVTPRREQCLAVLRAGNAVDFLASSPNPLVRKLVPMWRKARSVLAAHLGR